MVEHVREAAVAGRFYPSDPAVLARDVDRFVREGVAAADARPPKALIAPHAGYVYSGPIAGSAYRALEGARGRARRVVLLGPAHRAPVRSLARPQATAFATPLGLVRVDERLDALLPDVPKSDAAHAAEHSLEVHLPFLVRVLGPEITVAPLVVGGASSEEVARVLEVLWGGDETVVVVSSDLSHYLPYETARRIDDATARAIEARDETIDPDQACGARAIDGLMRVARRRGLDVERLDVRSSGDTAGSRDEVVGYGAFALRAPAARAAIDEDDAAHGRALVALARESVNAALGVRGARTSDPAGDPPWMHEPRAVFVTLHRSDGSLHGCIGGLEPERPLGVAVRRAARSAATEDPRSEEISAAVAPDLHVEVSVLGPMTPIPARTRAELIAALRPGEDGLVLSWKGHRATYLPQVWEAVSDPARFVTELLRKAGLPRDFWDDAVRAERYAVRKYEEPQR